MSRHRRKSTPSPESDGSESDASDDLGSDTDPTDIDTDSEDEGYGGHAVWLPEDEELPPEYWRKQHEELNDSEFEGQDYEESTTTRLDMIEERWTRYCRSIMHKDPHTAYRTLTPKFLYNFFDWYLSQKRNQNGRKLRGTNTASSLGLYWKDFRLVYEKEVGSKIEGKLTRKVHRVLRKLTKKHGLSLKGREKTPMDVDDLTLMVETNLTSTKIRYSHGRLRIETCLFLVLASLSGNRPNALLNLRYQDILVTLLRDPEGGPHRILIEFTPEFTKSYLGLKEGIKWPVPEVLYDPSLILSPHVYLLALIFADNAFALPGPDSPEQLSRLYVEDFKNEQPVRLKSELDDVYVFRQSKKTVYGVEVPLNSRLNYATLSPWVKKVGWLLGLVNVIPYGLRYNAAAEFDANADVSDSLRNLMMRHADSRTLIRHYLPRRINVDSRAIVHGLEPQRAMMKAASRMSRSIDPRRPHELTEDQSLSVNNHPRVLALVRRRDKLGRQFKGTKKSNKGTALYKQYADIGREIVNERQRQRRILMKEIRDKWEKEQPLRDVERQLSGLKFTEDVKSTLDHSAELPPEQKRLIETIMTLPGQTLEDEIRRRNAAITAVTEYCKFEEGGSIPRNHRGRPPKSTMPAVKAEDRPSNQLPRASMRLLDEAISSVYKEKRPRWCFLCLAKVKALVEERIRVFSDPGDLEELLRKCEFHSPGDLTKHFRRRHLSKPQADGPSECRLCVVALKHKNHLRNHALSIHGTFS